MIDVRTRAGLQFTVDNAREARVVLGVVDHDEYGLAEIELGPGNIVLDIGAHVGAFSITTAHRFPGVHIVAYEPNPDNFSMLVENVRRNGADVECHHAACWTHNQSFSLVGNGSGTGTIDADGSRLVPSVTLDEVLAPYNDIALVKMDCEGAEVQIITSASPATLRKVRMILGEYHDAHIKMGYVPEWRTILDDIFDIEWQSHPSPSFRGRRRDSVSP